MKKIEFGTEVGINKPHFGIEGFCMNLNSNSPIAYTCNIDIMNYKNSTFHSHKVDINSLIKSGVIDLDRLYEVIKRL